MIYENSSYGGRVYVGIARQDGMYDQYCRNFLPVVVPSVHAGQILRVQSVLGVSIRPFAQPCVVGWAIHMEPYDPLRGTPLNTQMTAQEHWLGEDLQPQWRVYLMARGHRVWQADKDYSNGVLAMLRVYAASELGPGELDTMFVMGNYTGLLTVEG